MIGELSALFTALLWSCSSIVFAEASNRIGSQQLNINRLIVAFVLLFLTTLITGFGSEISKNQIFYLSISGVIGLVFGDGFLFKAFQIIGARKSMLLMSLVPAITSIFGFIFLNEKLDFISIIGILTTMSGILLVLLAKKDKEESGVKKFISFGVLCGILGAIGQAGGLVFAKLAFQLGEINSFTATFIRITSSIIIFLPFLVIMSKYKNPIKLYRKDTKALLFTIAGSIIGPYLGITFSLIAIKYADVGIASTLMSTVPIMMLPIVRFIYKEKLTYKSIVGAIIAFIGVAILLLK